MTCDDPRIILEAMSDVRARELAAFLRTRRDRLSPVDVGLPAGGRRRVPGLRREEVAVLANVGTTWYTWLEQGRDVRPSVAVLTAIADALMLDLDERRHLLLLGGHGGEVETGPACDHASERLQGLLDALGPHPAVALTPRFEPIAYNTTYRYLIDDIEAVPPADRNCAYLHFTYPAWQAGHEDHEADCAIIVAKLRAYYADSLDDPSWAPFLERLRRESELFRRLWDRADVALDVDHVKTVRSVRVGRLRLQTTTLLLQENLRTRVVVYAPADDTTARRLDRLAELVAEPVDRRLRAVPS